MKNEKIIESITFEDANLERAYNDYLYTRNMMDADPEISLGDMAGIALKYLRQHGKLDKIEDAEGSGAYSVKINVNIGGEDEPWLLSAGSAPNAKNAIKAAARRRTCPYSLMRLTAAGDPLSKTMGVEPGRDPQGKIVRDSAAGFADFAMQSGIPVGGADEFYHPGLDGACEESVLVLSAAPSVDILREETRSDDEAVVIGTGGESEASYAYKIRRLLRNGEALRMIKKIEWGDDEEEAICFMESRYTEMFEKIASSEGLDCRLSDKDEPTGIEADADVTEPETAAERVSIKVKAGSSGAFENGYIDVSGLDFSGGMKKVAEDLNCCSVRGLVERMDSTEGGTTAFMPLGGRNQLTPAQAMVNLIPVKNGSTEDCTLASCGCNPDLYGKSPYMGAYLAVVEAVSRLIASGTSFHEIYLTIQGGKEIGADDERGGREIAALLGAFEAEMGLGIPAVNRDGSVFRDTAAPFFSVFAFSTGKAEDLCSPEFKEAGHRVVMLRPDIEADESSAYAGLPTPKSLTAIWRKAYELIAGGRAVAAYAPGMGGTAEAVMKMCFGNGMGFEFSSRGFDWNSESSSGGLTDDEIFGYSYGSIILEMADDEEIKSRAANVTLIGRTTEERKIKKGDEAADIGELLMLHEGVLESVYEANTDSGLSDMGNVGYSARSWHAPIFKRSAPKVLMPVMAGTYGRNDVERSVRDAGAVPNLLMLQGASEDANAMDAFAGRFAEALKGSQILILPAGFGGDDAAALLRHEASKEALREFLGRKEGLICGIGSGFTTLTETGLLPYAEVLEEDDERERPVMAANSLGAHQSRIVTVRVASNKSPWLRSTRPGEICSLPISCAEGRFEASDELIKRLAVNGQIATQYVDPSGNASADIRFNPAASMMAVESITSEDGRIIGRMCHPERVREGLYLNVPGNYVTSMFENAVRYFK